MENRYSFLQGFEIPKNLISIYEYLSNKDIGNLDLQIPINGEARLKSLLGKKAASKLIPLFSMANGSIISAWIRDKNSNLTNSPIVWIDSEGAPNSIFAMAFSELCGMLHYHLGILYDILGAYEAYKEDDSYFDNPLELYNDEWLGKDGEESWESNPDLKRFHQWLGEALQIPREKSVCSKVIYAIEKHPNFLKEIGIA